MEELERNAPKALSDVLAFLELPSLAAATATAAATVASAVTAAASAASTASAAGRGPRVATPSTGARYCLTGRHGVLHEPRYRHWQTSGRLDSTSEGGAGGGIGQCDESEDKVRGPDGVGRYKMEPSTEALLRNFFAPYNERLFTLLGRRLEW
jgi:hypothetical protein